MLEPNQKLAPCSLAQARCRALRSPKPLIAMRIATWNVNSIKQRIDNAVSWLAERQPDIVCLQETKCVDEAFPRGAGEALGYDVAVHGQKTVNGATTSSKHPVGAASRCSRAAAK